MDFEAKWRPLLARMRHHISHKFGQRRADHLHCACDSAGVPLADDFRDFRHGHNEVGECVDYGHNNERRGLRRGFRQ